MNPKTCRGESEQALFKDPASSHSRSNNPSKRAFEPHISAVMCGKKAAATSQCRLILVNGMPSMNRRPMDHHGRLATGLTVWSPGCDSPGVSFSSSSLGMGRALGPSSDVIFPDCTNVYLIPQCDSLGGAH